MMSEPYRPEKLSRAEREDNRKKWAVEYDASKMGSAEICSPPSGNFRRLYKLTTAEYAASSLWLGRLKLSTINDLNDPFELLGEVHRLKLGAHHNAMLRKERVHKRLGILCFSENWISPALWAHYADSHRGVCLGFNVRKTERLLAVCYRDSMIDPARNTDPTAPKKLKLRDLLKIKSADWRYEGEYRVPYLLSLARENGGLYFVPFCEDLQLAEIILGERCSLPLDKTRERAHRQYPGVCVVKARTARQNFAVVPDI